MNSQNILTNATEINYYEAALPTMQAVYHMFCFYGTLVILVPGWFLNFATSAVFMRKRFWTSKCSMGYYYSIYPLASNAAGIPTSIRSIWVYITSFKSVTMGFISFFPSAFGHNLLLASNASCRIIWYLKAFFVVGSVWLQVQISVDRAIHVLYPRRFCWLYNRWNLFKITCLIYLVSALFSITQLFRYVNPARQTCDLPLRVEFFFDLANLIYRLASFTILFVTSFLIVQKLFESKRNASASNKLSSKEYAFAFSLMTMNFILYICLTPFVVVQVIQIDALTRIDRVPSFYAEYVNMLFLLTDFGNIFYECLPFLINLSNF